MSTRNERTAVIEKLENEFNEAKGIFIADNHKINVEKVTKLRADFRKEEVSFVVVKNKLAKIAAEKSGKEGLVPFFDGPTAIAISKKDGTEPAKIIKGFQNENKELLGLRVAFVHGTILNSEDAIRLADIPSREVLLSQLLGCLQAPMGKFAGSLSGIFNKLTGTLTALKEKKEAE
jgi:large subunit ribosomal protein L10